jgi:phosphoglycolate phosphatase
MPSLAASPSRPLRAVLFDFDGTLADSYPAITASVNHVRAAHGLAPLGVDDVRPHVGRGPELLMDSTVGQGAVARNLSLYRAHHPSVMREGTKLLPGVVAALEDLRHRGLRLAVCSNKPVKFTRQLLEWLGMTESFEVVLGPEDVPSPKPAPDMLLLALRRLGVPAGEALYVGDMVVDIQTARAAGVSVWVVPTGSDERTTLEAAGPDRILDGFNELPGLIVQ